MDEDVGRESVVDGGDIGVVVLRVVKGEGGGAVGHLYDNLLKERRLV